MLKNEILERLERIARCAIHTVGEEPFVMSLDDGTAIHEAIDMLRSQPGPHWIPVTERLPEDDTVCLVTVHPDFIPPYVNPVDVLIYESEKWLFYNVDDVAEDTTCRIPIIAWMPLPEPYQEGE